MKYIFLTLPQSTDQAHVYVAPRLTQYAKTPEDAYQRALVFVASGDRIWTWFTEPEGACTMCGGPFHPATGHWESQRRHWCGVCTRSMVGMLKEMQPRRWGKVRFYDHAEVPSGDTSSTDLADQ